MVKLILGGVGILVVGVVIMRLLARLWLWGIALVVVGGVAAAAWFAFKPQLEAFKAKRLAARAEADAARTAAARDAAARKAEADAKQKLEDELARLKKQV
jgi:cytoskeletal protein RodZ